MAVVAASCRPVGQAAAAVPSASGLLAVVVAAVVAGPSVVAAVATASGPGSGPRVPFAVSKINHKCLD